MTPWHRAPKVSAWVLGALLLASLTSPAWSQASLLAQGCLGCHGLGGAGSGGIPGLAGRDRADLLAAMAAFRANERPATIMNRIVRGYTEAEVAAIASYFAGAR